MALPLVSNTYLDETTAKIRQKPVPWEGYQRANLMSTEEFNLVKKIYRQKPKDQEDLLLSEGKIYALLYLRLLKKMTGVDTLQCLLVLIADALVGHDERISLFTSANAVDPELPYQALLGTLKSQDEFLQLKSAQILTILLSSKSITLQKEQSQPILDALSALLNATSSNRKDVAVQCFGVLLSRQECRSAVWANADFVPGLRSILSNNPSVQTCYRVCFCFWLLTFDTDIAKSIDKKYDIIPLLVNVAQGAVKEKVIRVIVATFRNLVTKAPSENLPAMLVAQLLPFVKNLCGRKWTDEDIIDDIQFLRDELKANFDSLTTYDEYTSELASGHLSWTPVHESDLFWKENASKLNDKDFAQLKLLVKLLNESSDPVVLAVAAHDIGQYVKYTERGRKAVTELGAKTRVMELMTHEDSDVRYRALVSVQSLMSQPWQSL